jgi:hypothetical protein
MPDTTFLIENYVATRSGDPFRLFPFGKIVKGGKTINITPEFAASFKLPHFKPPIKLGSHAEATPAGGHITGLEVRADGLYAILEVTDQGAKALADGAYRYHSPEVIFDEKDGFEDPTTGKLIPGPLIIGDALLHTPHLGEATALYSVEQIKSTVGGDTMSDTVQVPAGMWDKFSAWFGKRIDEAEKPVAPPPAPELPEEFKAKLAERDTFKAELDAMKAEGAKRARVESFAAKLTAETVIKDGADQLSAMSDESAEWVLTQFKALSAQIKANDALTQTIGNDKATSTDPKVALNAVVIAYMAEHKMTTMDQYPLALEAVRVEKPELFK